ncbi:hypothetical protein [Actinomadura rifamycini]|uniref:hypothetical protein n=1 Tax=Actinomadura rifamycini TaxID=31962 RepID=UPI00047D9CC5|nr:hypothetical protein [Actinomadura rifamycini]
MFMKTFLQEFGSWYWDCAFDDAASRDAFDAFGTAESADDFRRAFLVLLRSGDVVARGVALDFYDRADATGRFGEESPFECFHDEVMEVAREMLAGPPRPGDDIAFAGADHASALLALKNDVRPEDGAAVLAVLRRRPDGSLLSNALMVAGEVLSISDEPELTALIAETAFDSSLDVRDRREAVRALGEAPGDEVTPLLVRAVTEEEDPWLRRGAATGLATGRRFYAHRELIERIVAEDDDARFLRYALDPGPHSTYWDGADPGSPRLARALDEIRSPKSERAHRAAFRALLHSGRVAAVGIALDHFSHDEGLTRFGLSTEPYHADVRALARHVLSQPPSSVPGTEKGACQASALDALGRIADPEDAGLLADLLARRDVPPLVRAGVFRAVAACLGEWDEPDERLIAAVERTFLDPAVPMDDRVEAVEALFDASGFRTVEALLRAVGCEAVPVQVAGAERLSDEDLIGEHRELLRNVAAAWPEEAPHEARLVRRRLAE